LKQLRDLNKNQKLIKRLFDLFFSFIGIFILIIPVLILIVLATLSTKKFGLYSQLRVGKDAILFTMYKIRTMHGDDSEMFITVNKDDRITGFGHFLRKFKLDEFPQLFNVLIGDMSFVGPRPDVKGYADELTGDDRIILTVRPGITGPATLRFRDEEEILARQSDPLKYNDEIIWKEKIEINKNYIKNWTLLGDLKFILRTIFS